VEFTVGMVDVMVIGFLSVICLVLVQSVRRTVRRRRA
jgi:hypothetical protein